MITKRHAHAFVVWLDYPGTPLQTRDVHRFTHRHRFESPAHTHEMNGLTAPSRFYDEQRASEKDGGIWPNP